MNATSGTTVFGAYDPLDKIYEVSSRYGLWLHVDGAWGAGAVCSRKYRHLMTGIERYYYITPVNEEGIHLLFPVATVDQVGGYPYPRNFGNK